jgi:hypothetical protein
VTTAQKPIPGSALAKLMAVLRPEFRADVYVPAPNDPVFISDQCIVADCDRTAKRSRTACAARILSGSASGTTRRWRSSSPTRHGAAKPWQPAL